jgi:hypothetical protein
MIEIPEHINILVRWSKKMLKNFWGAPKLWHVRIANYSDIDYRLFLKKIPSLFMQKNIFSL